MGPNKKWLGLGQDLSELNKRISADHGKKPVLRGQWEAAVLNETLTVADFLLSPFIYMCTHHTHTLHKNA